MYTLTSMYDINHMVETQYRRPSFLCYIFIKGKSNLKYMLDLISILTLNFVSEKKVLPVIVINERIHQFE